MLVGLTATLTAFVIASNWLRGYSKKFIYTIQSFQSVNNNKIEYKSQIIEEWYMNKNKENNVEILTRNINWLAEISGKSE